MKISLVHDGMVDRLGASYRMAEDKRQLGLSESDLANLPIEGFKDFGLVEYEGERYYMSMYVKVAATTDV